VKRISLPLRSQGLHRAPVSQLVLHAMGERVLNTRPGDGPVGEFPAYRWLAECGRSAHALIAPDGTITECLPREACGAHALGHNDGTLGVELLVAGRHTYDTFARTLGWDLRTWAPIPDRLPDPFTAEQYMSCGWWLAREAQVLDLTWTAVTTHQQIDPAKKFDPGPLLRWRQLQQEYERCAQERAAWGTQRPFLED
jgi:N-acetyl-anhydromuramyl-L-alanine amidase AmpD